MRVKIGNRYYDPNVEPVMIVFKDDDDRKRMIKHLQNMPDGNLKHCTFPDTMAIREVNVFMEISPEYPEVTTK